MSDYDPDATIVDILHTYRSNLDHLQIIRAQHPDSQQAQFDRDVLTALASIVSKPVMAEAIAIVADMHHARVALTVYGPVLRARLAEGASDD